MNVLAGVVLLLAVLAVAITNCAYHYGVHGFAPNFVLGAVFVLGVLCVADRDR